MTSIFMNYRHADPGGYVRHLYEWLRGHFGDQLFRPESANSAVS
jgi:hypothetical protein